MTRSSPSDPNAQDQLTRFLLPGAGVRGVHVRLDATWREIGSREDYPPGIHAMLGEACAAAALFTGNAKIDGRLSVQLRGEGALRTLFAECTAAGTLRGIAQFAPGAGDIGRDPRALGAGAVLAITIENPARNGHDPSRYQGLVELDAPSLAGVFEHYFDRSEQLPTRLLLAADGDAACGLMLQKLPGDEGDEDGWRRACALADTVGRGELLAEPAAPLLFRVFHEESPEAFAPRPLRFACSCSRERVAAMLQALGEDEARAAVIDGAARIRCEFCGQSWEFSQADLDPLFTHDGVPMATPTGLH